jgi:hypothetical protein
VTLGKILASTKSPSPDFEFIQESRRVFVAELKQLGYVQPSKDAGWTIIAKSDDAVEATRLDNAPSRVSDCIYNAYKQLVQYQEPKVLILLDTSPGLDVGDLEEAFNGCMVYKNKNVQYINIVSRKIAHGKINEVKNCIDLYIWIDQLQNSKTWFRYTTAIGKRIAHHHFHQYATP